MGNLLTTVAAAGIVALFALVRPVECRHVMTMRLSRPTLFSSP
jgi:hypothetical protein